MGKFLQWLGLEAAPEPTEPIEFIEEVLQGANPPRKEVSLSDILDRYEILEVVSGTDEHGPFLIVSEKYSSSQSQPYLSTSDALLDNENSGGAAANTTYIPPVVSREGNGGPISLKESPDLREIGSSSPSPYTAFVRREYNTDLQGTDGLIKYNKMRSDGVVSGTLLAFKTPVNAGRWFIEPVSDEIIDEEVARVIWACLTEYQSITWTQIKSESMLMCEYGYYMFEKVWTKRKIDGVNRTILQKLSPRHPMDVKEWKWDEHGGPKAVVMYVEGPNGDGSVIEKTIPIEKLLVLSLNREGGDIRGRSVLRSAYKHHYFKEQLYKIDAIQKERHGIGIPVIKLPPNFDEKDKIVAHELGRNLRTNERAHVVLPPYWEVIFAKLEGQPVDAIRSIEMHDAAIRENILASFMAANSVTKEEDLSLFLKATRFVADSICDAFNLYLIPELVKYNFEDVKPPKLRVRRIGEQADWRVQSFAIRNMVGAGIIRPDDRLEANSREEMDLPKADIKTTRIVAAPQAGQTPPSTMPNATPGASAPASSGKTDGTPDKPGLPRQTPVPNTKVPGVNAGNDKGGQS